MFCSKCGKEKETDGGFCIGCGSSFGTTNEGGVSKKSNEHGTYNAISNCENKKIVRFELIILLIAIAQCLFYFLMPLLTYGFQSYSPWFRSVGRDFLWLGFGYGGESVSGYTLTFGNELSVGQNGFAILILLIPAAMFIVYAFKGKISILQGKLHNVSLVLSVIGMIMLVISTFYCRGQLIIQNALHGEWIVMFTIWFYLAIILYAISLILSLKCIKESKGRDKSKMT